MEDGWPTTPVTPTMPSAPSTRAVPRGVYRDLEDPAPSAAAGRTHGLPFSEHSLPIAPACDPFSSSSSSAASGGFTINERLLAQLSDPEPCASEQHLATGLPFSFDARLDDLPVPESVVLANPRIDGPFFFPVPHIPLPSAQSLLLDNPAHRATWQQLVFSIFEQLLFPVLPRPIISSPSSSSQWSSNPSSSSSSSSPSPSPSLPTPISTSAPLLTPPASTSPPPSSTTLASPTSPMFNSPTSPRRNGKQSNGGGSRRRSGFSQAISKRFASEPLLSPSNSTSALQLLFEQTQRHFLSLFYQAIQAAADALTPCPAGWPAIYNGFLLASGRLLSPEQLQTQLDCIEDFHRSLAAHSPLGPLVASHAQFLRSRTVDPHNALVGHTPSMEILGHIGVLAPESSRLCSVCGSVIDLFVVLPSSSLDDQPSAAMLLQTILGWEQLDSPTDCQLAVRRFVSNFRAKTEFASKQQLFIVCLTPIEPPSDHDQATTTLSSSSSPFCSALCQELSQSFFLAPSTPATRPRTSTSCESFFEENVHVLPLQSLAFARYHREEGPGLHSLFIEGSELESSKILVKSNQLLVLPSPLLDKLKAPTAQLLAEITHNPAPTLFQACFRLQKAAAFRVLSLLEAPVPTIIHALSLSSPADAFPSYHEVESTLLLLHRVCDSGQPPPDVEPFLRSQHQSFASAIDRLCAASLAATRFKMPSLVRPGVEQEISQFQRAISGPLIAEVNRIRARLEVINDACRKTYQSFESGLAKELLNRSWQVRIKRGVDLFLQHLGFFHDAVSQDYIDLPAENISTVYHNRKIVTHILDPSKGDQLGFLPFVQDLTAQVYKEIDAFRETALLVIRFATKLPIDPSCPILELTDIVTTFRQTHPELPAFIFPLLQDIRYMDMMRQLDDEYFGSKSADRRLQITEVVPITGLIFNRIYRAEQELDTVIELHQQRAASPSSSSKIKTRVKSRSPPEK